MDTPTEVRSATWKDVKPIASPPTNGKQKSIELNNHGTKLAPRKCETPSCSSEVEAEPLAEGRDSQPSAPPPANGNQMPKELDDDDDAEEKPRKYHWPILILNHLRNGDSRRMMKAERNSSKIARASAIMDR